MEEFPYGGSIAHYISIIFQGDITEELIFHPMEDMLIVCIMRLPICRAFLDLEESFSMYWAKRMPSGTLWDILHHIRRI